MNFDILNIGLAFLEGLALIVSPCILPVLPLIFVGSLEGGVRRPLGVIVGFITAFTLFTFFSRYWVQHLGIDLTIVRNTSYVLLFFLGVIMLFPYLSDKFAMWTRRFASISPQEYTKSHFWNGFILGTLIGVIWTPCAGPILAAVILQTVLQQTSTGGFFVVLAFGIGAALPMLLITFFGKWLLEKVKGFQVHSRSLRQILGLIIIASVMWMLYGEGVVVSFPQSFQQQNHLINKLETPYAAPDIVGITEWINSKPLSLQELRGKVVLIDFWTYSCINCIRTLPYLNKWYEKYHHKGLEIIGVHSPEFEFERDFKNVKNAVMKFGIRYPVALDNQFATWQNYKNNYWPAHYLINKEGEVVYQYFGEGEYDIAENNIRFLLGMTEPVLVTQQGEERMVSGQTPETYLGYARAANYVSPERMIEDNPARYTFPHMLDSGQWALQGGWKVEREKIVSTEAGAELEIYFNARKVFVVMGVQSNQSIPVTIVFNGKNVKNNSVIVKEHKLYEILDASEPQSGILKITATAPGLEVYVFTFG